MDKKSQLNYYPKKELNAREKYLDGSSSSISMCLLRLGDLHSKMLDKDGNEICPLCRQRSTPVNQHIIAECQELLHIRVASGLQSEIEDGKTLGMSDQGIILFFLDNLQQKNQKGYIKWWYGKGTE